METPTWCRYGEDEQDEETSNGTKGGDHVVSSFLYDVTSDCAHQGIGLIYLTPLFDLLLRERSALGEGWENQFARPGRPRPGRARPAASPDAPSGHVARTGPGFGWAVRRLFGQTFAASEHAPVAQLGCDRRFQDDLAMVHAVLRFHFVARNDPNGDIRFEVKLCLFSLNDRAGAVHAECAKPI